MMAKFEMTMGEFIHLFDLKKATQNLGLIAVSKKYYLHIY